MHDDVHLGIFIVISPPLDLHPKSHGHILDTLKKQEGLAPKLLLKSAVLH